MQRDICRVDGGRNTSTTDTPTMSNVYYRVATEFRDALAAAHTAGNPTSPKVTPDAAAASGVALLDRFIADPVIDIDVKILLGHARNELSVFRQADRATSPEDWAFNLVRLLAHVGAPLEEPTREHFSSVDRFGGVGRGVVVANRYKVGRRLGVGERSVIFGGEDVTNGNRVELTVFATADELLGGRIPVPVPGPRAIVNQAELVIDNECAEHLRQFVARRAFASWPDHVLDVYQSSRGSGLYPEPVELLTVTGGRKVLVTKRINGMSLEYLESQAPGLGPEWLLRIARTFADSPLARSHGNIKPEAILVSLTESNVDDFQVTLVAPGLNYADPDDGANVVLCSPTYNPGLRRETEADVAGLALTLLRILGGAPVDAEMLLERDPYVLPASAGKLEYLRLLAEDALRNSLSTSVFADRLQDVLERFQE